MGEQVTPSGLIVSRALDPSPASVGGDVYRPGDPNGVTIEASGPLPPPPPVPRVQPWSGWPAEWATPNWWGRVETLTDTAWMCLDLNASLLATMPPYLVNAAKGLPTGWMTNPDPDLYTSWEEFAKQLFWDFQMGEAFVVATAYHHNGFPARFHVVSPWLVNVEMESGRRRYYIGNLDVTADMLHVRYQSRTDDAHGHGPLEAGRSRLVAARMLTEYGTQLAATGAVPNSVLIHPDELNGAQAADLQNAWIQARMSTLGLPAVLSGGVTFQTLSLSPKDMALLDLLQFNEARIAVLLGVPPFLVALPSGGDPLTYNTVLMALDYHWRGGLRPKAQVVMSALSGWLTPRGTTVEVNRDEYVRPDPLTRAQTWQIYVQMGVLTAAQVAEFERFALLGTPQPPTTPPPDDTVVEDDAEVPV